MRGPLLHDHPLLASNALMTRGADGHKGSYNFIVDLIASTRSIHEVQSFHGFHEVLHRATSNYGKLTNSFSLLRRLAGIGHALLMQIVVELEDSGASLKGGKLPDLAAVGGSSEKRERIASLFQRLSYLESIYDMGWRATIPVAELVAVDFSHDLHPNSYFYDGWNIQWYYHSMARGNRQTKLDQLKHAVQDYPADFGGYHVKYGSFQAAMERAFAAYESVANNELRYPILELALHILWLDRSGQLMVNDAIEMIVEASSVAGSETKEKALEAMARHRVAYGYGGAALVEGLTRELLSDIPPPVSSHRNLTVALSYLMLEQRAGHLDGRTPWMFSTSWVETLSRSFMRVDLGETGQPLLSLNPNYILTAHQRLLGLRCDDSRYEHPNSDSLFKLVLESGIEEAKRKDQEWTDLWRKLGLETDWWRRLALLEALRYSLKSGKSLVCPFKGWQFSEAGVESLQDCPIKCDETCFIRLWLRRLATKTEIVGDNATCEAWEENALDGFCGGCA